MAIINILSAFVALANISLGIFVLVKGIKKRVNIVYFFLSFVTAGWVVSNWFTYIFLNYQTIDFFDRLTYAFSALIVPLFFTFTYLFPEKQNNKFSKLNIIGMYLSWFLGITFAAFSLFTNLVDAGPIIVEPYLTTIAHGPLYPLFFIYFIFFIIWAFILLIIKYISSQGIDRQKLYYVLIGYGIAALFGTTGNLFLEAWLSDIKVKATSSLFGPLFTIFMVGSMAYAILRYRLMDIKIVLRKSIVHFLSIIIVLFIYLYLLLFFQRYLVNQYDWPVQTSTLLLVLVIVLTIEPLRRFLFKMVDRAFYARQRTSREESRRMKQLMSSSLQFDLLINRLVSELSQSLDVPKTTFLWNNKKTGTLESYSKNGKNQKYSSTDPLYQFLRDSTDVLITEEIPYLIEDTDADKTKLLQSIEKDLKKNHVGLVLPVGEKGELVGAFMMELRKKKEAFTSDDVEYLAGLQFQLTSAIANALLYKQAVERIAKIH